MSNEEKNMKTTLLRNLPKHSSGVISAVDARGEMGRRIRDMGLVPGVRLQVLGRAPLQDPVAIRIKDFTLTLRNNEADHIYLKEVAPR
jgi:ferrous iron transport protein A